MNNLEKDFLEYQEALELKQLGFDENCFYVKIISNPEFVYTPSDYDDYPEQKEKEVLIPTYSQAFRWFRENHKLIAGIFPNNHSLQDNTSYIGYVGKFKKGNVEVYETYEEAELGCLKKLIEIVKNGR